MASSDLLVTIATQRSGTKFLGSCFNGGTLVRAFGEPLQSAGPEPHLVSFLRGYLPAQAEFGFRSTEMRALLDAFLDHLMAASDRPVAHLDIMYNNLGALSPIWSWPDAESFLCRVFKARRAAVIHLVRPSLAECHASSLIAEARGYHSTRPFDPGAHTTSITADLADAERAMRAILAARHFVRRFFQGYGRYLEITYPDFTAGTTVTPETRSAIARLLKQPPDSLLGHSPLRPTAPDKATAISNYAALQSLAVGLEA